MKKKRLFTLLMTLSVFCSAFSWEGLKSSETTQEENTRIDGMPKFDTTYNILFFEDIEQYRSFYQYLEKWADQRDIDEGLDKIEAMFPGYISYRTWFNTTYNWLDGAFTEKELEAIYAKDIHGDDIAKTLYNQYSEIGIGEYVYTKLSENMTIKTPKTKLHLLETLRKEERGGDKLPEKVLKQEGTKLLSKKFTFQKSTVYVGEDTYYESSASVSSGVCEVYRKGLRVALDKFVHSDDEDCAPYCWSQSLYTADEIKVDWGDGSPIETHTSVSNINLSHTYTTLGTKTITTTITFTDHDGTERVLSDTTTVSVNDIVCGAPVEFSVTGDSSSGDYLLACKMWFVEHIEFAYQAIKSYSHSWKRQPSGLWKRKRAEIYVKIDNSIFRDEACNYLQTVTGDKHRNWRKKVQKTKEITEAGYYINVRASNGEVKTYHYLKKDGVHLTKYLAYYPCEEEEPCEEVVEAVNYLPMSDVLGDGAGVHTYPTLTGDVNGDGKQDLIFVGQNWSGAGLNVRTKLSNGDGTWTATSDVLGDGIGVHTYPTHVGDVNGDGKADLVFVGQNWSGAGLNVRTKLSNGDGTWTAVSDILGDGIGVHTYPSHIGDVNGDGKADLVFVGQNWSGAGLNIRTKLSNGDGTWTAISNVQGDGVSVHTHPSHMGDVNGDGKADLVFVGQNWSGTGLNVRTKLSNGDGTWTHTSAILGDGAGVHTYPSHMGDVNGDGKDDLVFIGQNWSGAGLNIRTKLSNGDGTWTHKSDIQGDGIGVHSYPTLTGDFNGDCLMDIAFVGRNWGCADALFIRTKLSNGDGSWTHYHELQGDGAGVLEYPVIAADVADSSNADLVFVGQNWNDSGLHIRTKAAQFTSEGCCLGGPFAEADFIGGYGINQFPSYYGETAVHGYCPGDKIIVNGAASSCENRYFLEIAEFDLTSWTLVGTPLFSDWICTDCTVPDGIAINDLVTPGSLEQGKIYKFKLAVGTPWVETNQFFTYGYCKNGAVISTEGIHIGEKPQVEIFPNPATNNIRIDTRQISNAYSIKIYDLTGNLVRGQKLEKQQQIQQMSLTKMPPGLYMVSVYDKHGVLLVTNKLVKK
ncbi:FG-GAP-like repeat-containing protein [Aquimarina hainanensis]|uniref:FG-GAP-like repeat-containing protein n=1 Tax=Aquimarina hainanensis TaxID=1578017 RepID=A0ABW5NG19_9FLAO